MGEGLESRVEERERVGLMRKWEGMEGFDVGKDRKVMR
jgi:hypothetical protein